MDSREVFRVGDIRSHSVEVTQDNNSGIIKKLVDSIYTAAISNHIKVEEEKRRNIMPL